MEPKSPSKSKFPTIGFNYNQRAWKFVAILLIIVLLLAAGLYVVLQPWKNHFVLKRPYFTVVIDCGSTGTRVNVYEWMLKGDLSDGNLPILIHSYPDNSTSNQTKGGCWYHCLQTEPGLDKWAGNSSGVRASLKPLILWAERLIPPKRHVDTPLLVLATAGLRRLPREDSRLIMDDIEAVVKEHAFLYQKNWIRILTGKEEAYYGWIALNFKMGSFNYSSRSPTLGLLDLGGSSLQVVTEIDESKGNEHYLRSSIGPFEHHLLAYSLPSFGLNEAFDRTVVMLSHSELHREGAGGNFEVCHPCLSSSFVQNFTCKGCFGQSSTDPVEVPTQVRRNRLSPMFLVGNSNWEQCTVLARAAAVNSSSSDWSSPKYGPNSKADCGSINGSVMLNLTGATHSVARFHALSGFFAVYTMLNLSSKANFSKIWEEGQHLCSRSWADSSSVNRNQNSAAQYCFKVSYMTSLIEDALCLGKEEIVFGPGDVSWTLGAVLAEGEFLWNGSTSAWTHVFTLKNTRLISSPVIVFILLACLLFFVYRSQIKLPMPSRKITAVGASLPSYIYPKCRPN